MEDDTFLFDAYAYLIIAAGCIAGVVLAVQWVLT